VRGNTVRKPFARIVFAVLVIASLAIIARQYLGIAGLDDDGWSLIGKVAVLVLVGTVALVTLREPFSRAIALALVWVMIALTVAVGYTFRLELRDVAERVLAEFVPGRAATHGRTVEIARGGAGGFSLVAQINGAPVNVVLDTGATAVYLTQEAAKAAGLPLEVLSYTVPVDTANGRGRAAAVTLDRLAVGGIIERAVPALIAQPGQLRTSLLGMSFLNRLESWQVRGDRLMLRGYP
jgi:aspartyl protease family protein